LGERREDERWGGGNDFRNINVKNTELLIFIQKNLRKI